MKRVSKEEFFTAVGSLNVQPVVDASTLKDRHHISRWEMQDGTRKIIGRSQSDSWGIKPTKFFTNLPEPT